MKNHIFTCEVGVRPLTIRVGEMAEQASGAALVQYGDSVVLATACVAEPREGLDFLPLTVDCEERLYAAGKIPGSFFRREGRPSQEAILSDRLTDRSLRPLFPKGFRNEVQVIVTSLSADQVNPLEVLSIIGASCALMISEIPFDGPVVATRVGYLNGQFVVNPTFEQLQGSRLDLVVAGTRDAVVMVEAGAKEVPESVALEALRVGQLENQKVVLLQEEIARLWGKQKMSFVPSGVVSAELDAAVASLFQRRLEDLMDRGAAKGERNAALDALSEEAPRQLGEAFDPKLVGEAFDGLVKRVMRAKVLGEGKRPDGRKLAEIRPVSAEVGVLPRTHGSALFRRGQTQVLTIGTLGSLGEMQKLDTLAPEEKKRFMHHYNFPPFSVGEVRRLTGPGRREIGHGALAERALLPVIPREEEFPYTIRLVSEVLSSNGSTSMASVCAGSLALMDAGVPIKTPVAGIAMGLVLGAQEEAGILSDIQGIEDFYGDMDYKVAGTAEGITALQLDVKVKGISFAIVERALAQAREGRLFILDRMRSALAQPRAALSPYAPRILKITIPVEKIGSVIGPGGRTIRSIIEKTKTTIDVANDGTVMIGSTSEEAAQKAKEAIQSLTREAEVGQIYTGKVTRVMNFGAFVEIFPGKEGLVPISELADRRLERVEEEVEVGDEVTVVVTEIDRLGRVNLSRRAVFAGQAEGQQGPTPGQPPREAQDQRPRPFGPPGRGGDGRMGQGPPRRDRPPFGPGRGPGGPRPGGRGTGGPGGPPRRYPPPPGREPR